MPSIWRVLTPKALQQRATEVFNGNVPEHGDWELTCEVPGGRCEEGGMCKCGMKRTCLKSVLDDMTLWRTMRGWIRKGWREKGGVPMLVAWMAAAPRTRDNMTLSGRGSALFLSYFQR
jgi:hypothetical protein